MVQTCLSFPLSVPPSLCLSLSLSVSLCPSQFAKLYMYLYHSAFHASVYSSPVYGCLFVSLPVSLIFYPYASVLVSASSLSLCFTDDGLILSVVKYLNLYLCIAHRFICHRHCDSMTRPPSAYSLSLPLSVTLPLLLCPYHFLPNMHVCMNRQCMHACM